LADSAAFARWLVPLADVDKLDGASVCKQMKSKSKGKPCYQGINNLPSGLLPLSWHTLTGSKGAGTPPDTIARRLLQHVEEYGLNYTCKTNREYQKHQFCCHKHTYVQQRWEHQDIGQEQSSDSLSSFVPKKGTRRAPSHAPDSEGGNGKKASLSFCITGRIQEMKSGVQKAIHPSHVEDVCGPQGV